MLSGMSTNTTHLSRLLATAALTDPPNPDEPAIIYRRNVDPSKRPERAVQRSPYGHLLRCALRDGTLYVWRDPDQPAPPAPPEGTVMPTHYRPLPETDITRTALPTPAAPAVPAPVQFLLDNPGASAVVRQDCHKSLAGYYRTRHPQLRFTHRAGDLYGTNPSKAAHVLPPNLPDFYRAEVPPRPQAQRLPHDRPAAGTVSVYLHRHATRTTATQAFPDTPVYRDIQGTPHDRYLPLPHDRTLTDYQTRYLAQQAAHVLLHPDDPEPPPFLAAVHAHQALALPCNTYAPQTATDGA